MKRTKNMMYKETSESFELYLYLINDYNLYMIYESDCKALMKKVDKGIFDDNKAIDLFYYLTTEASKRYNKDFGYSFSTGDRFTVAVMLVRDFMEEYGLR